MNVWIINLNPDLNYDAREEFKKWCVDNGQMFMGWRVKGTNPSTKDEFLEIASTKWSNKRGFIHAANKYFEAAKGDLCVLRGAKGKYYIGKIDDEAPFLAPHGINGDNWWLDLCSWGRKVIWCEMGELGNVPYNIVAQLSAQWQKTIDKRLDKVLRETTELMWNIANNINISTKPISVNIYDFARVFSPNELEDLVGIYLQKKFNYVLIPSSCKISTHKYEYYLRDNEGNSIYVQVKNQEKIDMEYYFNSDGTCYLFSALGYYNQEQSSLFPNIIKLDADELYIFLQENKKYFPHIIRYYELN